MPGEVVFNLSYGDTPAARVLGEDLLHSPLSGGKGLQLPCLPETYQQAIGVVEVAKQAIGAGGRRAPTGDRLSSGMGVAPIGLLGAIGWLPCNCRSHAMTLHLCLTRTLFCCYN
jgi:hypothetical protein